MKKTCRIKIYTKVLAAHGRILSFLFAYIPFCRSFTMPGRIHFTVGLIVALSIAVMLPSLQKSRIDSIAPLALGLLLGLLIAETPVASPIQELLGLSSRHPNKVGLDVLHDSSAMDAKKAKTELNQKSMYGLQHAFLNLEVTGWWFNMGLWDKSRNMRFQDACQALVDKVTQNLNITSDSHILGKDMSTIVESKRLSRLTN